MVSILRQVCGSLAKAHGMGLVHCDIKPANIILCHRGGVPDFVKVLDFGLAKAAGVESQAGLNSADSITGTPLYLSPESIERPDAVDARSDLYALGAVGYFLLIGTPVFRGATIAEVCGQHLRVQPEPPSQRLGRPISSVLEAVIMKCLAKAPWDRPQSATAMAVEFAECEVLCNWNPADAESWWCQFKAGAGVAEPAHQIDSTVETMDYVPRVAALL